MILAASAVLIFFAENTFFLITLLYNWLIIFSECLLDADTTFEIFSNVLILSPGFILSGE